VTEGEPLKILHLTGASDAGGLSRYLLDLCQGLRERGHQITIVGQKGAWHDRFEKLALPWIELPMRGGPLALRRAAETIDQFLSEHRPEVIHTHYRKPTLVARRAVDGRKIPILYTVHQPRISLAWPWRMLSDFGDFVQAPSQDARRWLEEDARVAAEKITVIPHGVDVSRYPRRDAAIKAAARKKLGIEPSDILAAFVGRLDFPKNPDWMIDVADASRAALPNLKIIVAGDGPDAPSMQRIIAQRNLSDRVILLGESDALTVYQASDALLSPSLREGFGLVCAEAMCVGIPVFRTHTGGSEEMIIEGVTGRSVPVDRKLFVAEAVKFLSDRKNLEKMGQAAAERIRSDFTLDRQIDRTIELYREIKRRRLGAEN
jgi:glycosyltransferase involved in cell wall biosynthesis